MLKVSKIPFVNENLNETSSSNNYKKKTRCFICVENKKNLTSGIITDGQIRRINQQERKCS